MTEQETRRIKRMRTRILILSALALILPALVLKSAFELQVLRAPQLREKAEGQYLREVPFTPKRGTIYDRDGAELALSVDVDSVWANPKQLRKAGGDPHAVAQELAGLLNLDADSLAQRLAMDRSFVWVKRRVTASEGRAVRGRKLPGVAFSEEARRFYPNRELAAQLLGYSNVDGQGIEGLELMLDDKLRGAQRSTPALLDRRGAVVFSEQMLDDRDTQGNDVMLTIDKTVQHFAERELELAVRGAEARAGMVVVLDPNKGELLAVASYPSFNPNEPQRFSANDRRNRAITDRFEPGSTLKPFTVAGALAAGAIAPSDSIDCSAGSLRVDGNIIHDVHQFGHLHPAEIIAFSSNVGASRIGAALGRPRLHKALSGFGFGAVSGSGLPGETTGSLRPYQSWYAMDAATIPFGQGMSTTTLQLTMAMGALANRGRLMEPTIVKKVVDAHGDTIEQAVPHIRQQVVPEHVARMVTDMMVAVTAPGGTGTEAAVSGYLVAGKTGTAQKSGSAQNGYSKDKWISSFVGFAPAQKPRLVIAVVLDEPMIAHRGGEVAAPAFRRIMEASLRHLGVPAQSTGVSSDELLARAPRSQAKVAVFGALPPPPAAALANTAAVGAGEALVPNLVGRSARDAIVQARRAQFDVTLQGSGVVSSQDPVAGSVVARGATLGLRLSAPPSQAEPHALDVDLAAVAPGAAESPRGQTVSTVSARGGQDG
jgi:cell division protein FtsI (penicillin-binding protein 3)